MKYITIFLQYAVKEILSPLNYILALVVGVIINIFQQSPVFSSFVPYIIPFTVQVLSKSGVKFKSRKKEILLQLPDKRVDPAFIMDEDGNILESTGLTQKLFIDNNIKTIYKFFGHPDDCSLEKLDKRSCYSPITEKWYSIQTSQPDKSGYLLVWLTNASTRVEYDKNLKTIREFNNHIINSLDELVVHNDIIMRLANLIFNYHYSSIVIMQLKGENLEGEKFRKFESGMVISEPIKISVNSLAPVLLSRRVSKVISASSSEYSSQVEFESVYPFDSGVKKFVGDSITNFVNYYSGNLSIIAFNKTGDIVSDDILSMEAFVDTAMVTHSLVELAIKNDRKFMQSIDGLCASAEFSDEMTGMHLQRVNKFSEMTAELYGMDKNFCKAIGQVASVHDIGKVAIPHIIKLERKLTVQERLELNMHPIYGAQIISRMMDQDSREYKFEMAYQIALNHHQMWNGNGYPAIVDSDGKNSNLTSRHYIDYQSYKTLKAENIPLEALFVSLADKYDALRSARHYKPAFTHEKTISILQKDDRSGVSGEDIFGQKIFQLFMENNKKFDEIYDSMKD
jgi:HD-GYP domain-containing protein (c-di-GMP phosphodiesterase class II)